MTNEQIFNELAEIRAEILRGACPSLSIDEAIKYTGLKRSYLYKLVHNNEIPYYKTAGGKLLRFKRAELDKWLTAVRVPSNAELAEQASAHIAEKGGE